ncbi:hypothetical protein GN956_G19780 [Arapaima gigas]
MSPRQQSPLHSEDGGGPQGSLLCPQGALPLAYRGRPALALPTQQRPPLSCTLCEVHTGELQRELAVDLPFSQFTVNSKATHLNQKGIKSKRHRLELVWLLSRDQMSQRSLGWDPEARGSSQHREPRHV